MKSVASTIQNNELHFVKLKGFWVSIFLGVLSLIGLKNFFIEERANPLLTALSVCWILHGLIHSFLSKRVLKRSFNAVRKSIKISERHLLESLGVIHFRKILVNSPFKVLSLTIWLKGGKSDFERLLREIYTAEKTHSYSVILTVTISLLFLYFGSIAEGLLMILICIPFHIYPIMLQRWSRCRLLEIIKRNGS